MGDRQPLLIETYYKLLDERDYFLKSISKYERREAGKDLIADLISFFNRLFDMHDTYNLVDENPAFQNEPEYRAEKLRDIASYVDVPTKEVRVFLLFIPLLYFRRVEQKLGGTIPPRLVEMDATVLANCNRLKSDLGGDKLNDDFFTELTSIIDDLGKMNEVYELIPAEEDAKIRNSMLTKIANIRVHVNDVKLEEVTEFIDEVSNKYFDVVEQRLRDCKGGS